MNINFWERLKNKKLVIYTSFGNYEWKPKIVGYFK
jgi:hypothetical protein